MQPFAPSVGIALVTAADKRAVSPVVNPQAVVGVAGAVGVVASFAVGSRRGAKCAASVGVVVCRRLRRLLSHRLTWQSSGTGRQRLRLGVMGCILPHPRCRPWRPAPYFYVRTTG